METVNSGKLKIQIGNVIKEENKAVLLSTKNTLTNKEMCSIFKYPFTLKLSRMYLIFITSFIFYQNAQKVSHSLIYSIVKHITQYF